MPPRPASEATLTITPPRARGYHGAYRFPGPEEDTPGIDGEDFVPLLCAHFGQADAREYAGVVNPDVDAAELSFCHLRGSGDRRCIADVHVSSEHAAGGAPTEIGCGAGGHFGIHIADQHVGAGFGKAPGNASAEPLGAPRDHSRPAR